jgi:uncharacterized protein YndB with AHSA1/START domain
VAAKNSPAASATSDREIVITRVFDAPRELVFRAWTDPEHVKRWWWPKGFTLVFLEMDVRPGGAWRRCIRSPDGVDRWPHGVYREIVEPERLAFTYVVDGPRGGPGYETLVTLDFDDLGARTKMTFRQAVFESVAARDAHRGGWTGALERFAEYLANTVADFAGPRSPYWQGPGPLGQLPGPDAQTVKRYDGEVPGAGES